MILSPSGYRARKPLWRIASHRQPPVRKIELHRTYEEWQTIRCAARENVEYHYYLEADIAKARI